MNKKYGKKCVTFIIVVLCIITISQKVHARYNFKYTLKAFSLSRKPVIVNEVVDESINDNISPNILGIEDGKTYSNNVDLQYNDNDGINYIVVKFKSKNNENMNSNIDMYHLIHSGEYKIIVSDFSGNICEKNIKIEQ